MKKLYCALIKQGLLNSRNYLCKVPDQNQQFLLKKSESFFVEKHYHVLDIGAGNCGKSYCVKNTSNRVYHVDKFTEPIAARIPQAKNISNDVAFLIWALHRLL